MTAKDRAKALVAQYRKDSLPYDIEQFITYTILDANKQARAEVLAAYVKHECYGCESGWPVWKEGNSWWHPLDKTKGAGVTEDCKASWLRDLQPAASDLEELLGLSRLEGQIAEHGPPFYCSSCRYHSEAPKSWGPCERKAELEKARASEESTGS
jgi:hypothetical protein